jgi:hypothetical protein
MAQLLDAAHVTTVADAKASRLITGTEFADHFSYHIILNEDCKIVHVGSAFKCAQCCTCARAHTGLTSRSICSKNDRHFIESSP